MDRNATLDHVETWIFDLDNTLYHARYNLFDLVEKRIGLYIQERFGVDQAAARRMQKEHFRAHGTTMRGLMEHHAIDPDHFLDYVHDIDYGRIPAAPNLDAALDNLGGRKLVFTNGSVRHAEQVMDRLGVARHFSGIFDIAASAYLPKPRPEPYAALCGQHGIDAPRAAMFEDIARNLAPAHALGMTTVWVRTASEWAREGGDGDHVHHRTDDLETWLGDLVARRRALTDESPSLVSRC